MKFVDFFAGIGGIRSGLEQSDHQCVGYCEYDKYARKSYEAMYDTKDEWKSDDVRTVNSADVPKADLWCFGFPCFVAGTLVYTSNGMKPIEAIRNGDEVLTHKLRYRKVIQTMHRKTNEIYQLKPHGMKLIETTSEHPFWVSEILTHEDGIIVEPAQWVKAKNLVVGDHWLSVPMEIANSSDIGVGIVCDGLVYVPIESIEVVSKQCTVYNIGVEEDESYTANTICCHNCQDLSLAGKKKGLQEGERSGLFYEIIRILRGLREENKPKWLLIENVKNLISIGGGFDFLRLLVELDGAGYDAEWQLFNSKNFEMPQNRERMFIVGHLRGECGRKIFPIYGTTAENPCQLQEMTKGVSDAYRIYNANGLARTLKSEAGGLGAKTGLYAIDGLKIKEATKKGYAVANVGDSVNLAQPNSKTRRGRVGKQIANTIVCSDTMGVVTEDMRIRKLTPREAWRLQGFSDLQFDKAKAAGLSNTQLYKQAGNAVGVKIALAIGKKLAEIEREVTRNENRIS